MFFFIHCASRFFHIIAQFMPRTYLFFVSVSLKRPRGGFSRFFLHFYFLFPANFWSFWFFD